MCVDKFCCRFYKALATRTSDSKDLRSLLAGLGFSERIRGSHHIFTKPDVFEILNLQPRGSYAKAYQVKQVRKVIVRYKLTERAE